MQDQRNLLLAFALSLLVLFGWEMLTPKRVAPPPQPAPVATTAAPPAAQAPVAPEAARSETLAQAPRIAIDTPRLHGSLSLAGGRIDDLVLVDYYETTERKQQVTLLSPAGSAAPYYVELGWAPEGDLAVPTGQTVWTGAADQRLTPETPVTLTWDNGAGLVFTRTISVDRSEAIVPHAPSCAASIAARPNLVASTRSNGVGLPPRWTWPSTVTRTSLLRYSRIA